MLHRNYIPIQKYKTSTLKNEYEYLYKKDKQLKVNGNEGNIEYDDDF